MEDHDWKSDLDCLFNPRSIALVGASDSSPRARAIFSNLREFGYAGKIFPVNPNRDEVFGLKCYRAVLDIPEAVDAFILAVPRDSVLPVLKQCAEKDIKSGVVVSAGFAEASEEGRAIQEQVKETAEKGKIRLCGPNSFGVAGIHEKAAMLLGTDIRHIIPGGIGIIFQSGGLLNFILLAAWDRGWGLSYAISCGNEAVLNVTDYLAYLVRDERTRVIGILTEGISDPRKFLAAAQTAAELEKPIIVLKIGGSEKGGKAAQAHTGTMVGSDAVYDAVFKQNGITRVRDLDDFIETMELFSKRKRLKGDGIGFIVPSGAECGLIADIAEEAALTLPDPSPETVNRISKVQSSFLSVRNPMNAPEQYVRKAEIFQECIDSFLNDPNWHIVGLRLPLPRLREDKDVVDRFIDVAKAAKKTDKLLVLFSRASVSLPEYWRKLLSQHNIPFLLEYRKGFRAIKALIRYYRFIGRDRQLLDTGLDFALAPGKTSLAVIPESATVTERQSKQILARYGIPITREGLASTAAQAVTLARELGYPVALKVESPQISHKTDARAVKVNIKNDSELGEAYNEILINAKKYDPEAKINGILVQEMVHGGREIIIGMTQDPQWGPVILFGLGGIFVEIIKDISMRLAPLTKYDIYEMFSEVNGFRILQGIRGEPEADIDAVVEILLRFSRLSVDLGDRLAEIDINPLVVFAKGKGAKVVDCLMIRR